jgi:hypothetical protein
MEPTDSMDQAKQTEVCGRRSAVDAIVVEAVAVVDVAAGHKAAAVVAGSGLVVDVAAGHKAAAVVAGSGLVVDGAAICKVTEWWYGRRPRS